MQYFKIDGVMTNNELVEKCKDRRASSEVANMFAYHTSEYNKKNCKDGLLFIHSVNGLHMQLCAVTFTDNYIEKHLVRFLRGLSTHLADVKIEEDVYSGFENMLRHAYRQDYIEDDDDIKSMASLDGMSRRWGRFSSWDENLIAEGGLDLAQARNASDAFLGAGVFSEELDRIFEGKDVKVVGHPVHYLIQTDSRDNRKEMYRTLLGCLYNRGRIHNRRYTYLDINGFSDIDSQAFEALYHAAYGGSVVIRYTPQDNEEEGVFASSERETIEFICHLMKKYRNRVLTVLCFPRECAKTKALFYENLENMCLIELREDLVSGDDACRFLKYLAKQNNIRVDARLTAEIEDDKAYDSSELTDIFERWYDHKLRNTYYPQYKANDSVKKTVQKAVPKGSAYDRLQSMIGLDSAKNVIGQALDYYKALKLFKDRGMKQDHPAMHMCFTGAPGTAKTSVARLFAEIMKDNGLLTKGQLIECGRQDLVGKYVGWTAPTVQRKFKEARGGVLFIDEAYSLVDDRDGSFGDEAISAIVAEMENHREDVVVIFAGYSDKMEGFLNKNPGLRSRIAFHVPFDDYDSNELVGITGLLAKDKGMKLSADAEEKLVGIFDEARKHSDFGNGRFARNVVEKARMKQAGRLVRMDLDQITDDDLVTIKAEDIEIPEIGSSQTERRIGFCA